MVPGRPDHITELARLNVYFVRSPLALDRRLRCRRHGSPNAKVEMLERIDNKYIVDAEIPER